MSVLAAVAVTVLAAVLIIRSSPPRAVRFITGVVLRDEPDPNKQLPIDGATITATSGATSARSSSDTSGLFRLPLRPAVVFGQTVHLAFGHRDYNPMEITEPANDQLLVIRLLPVSRNRELPAGEPEVAISNVRVRYALRGTTTMDVGSAARTFEIVNTGNIPCSGRRPCSPDGKWKAARGSLWLDAGASKQFRNVRVSCVAGPCPFTKVESNQYSRGGQRINISVLDWSDTVTYLVEAEVADTMVNETVLRSYPVMFGRAMNFTLPAAAEGPSIEAELNGSEIVFPLGPRLILSWAVCRMETGPNGSRIYRCELKPQYRFK